MRQNIDYYLNLVANYRKECSWISAYGAIPYLAKLVNAKSILEIGVAYGYHADFILQKLPEINYIGVDPYKANYDPDDLYAQDVHNLFKGNDNQESMDIMHDVVYAKLQTYNGRATLHRTTCEGIASQLDDQSQDLIFIDGDHTYNGLTRDLHVLWNKFNHKTGVLCGDDVNWAHDNFAVKRAIDDFFSSKGLQYRIFRFQTAVNEAPREVWVFSFNEKVAW